MPVVFFPLAGWSSRSVSVALRLECVLVLPGVGIYRHGVRGLDSLQVGGGIVGREVYVSLYLVTWGVWQGLTHTPPPQQPLFPLLTACPPLTMAGGILGKALI